MNTRIEVTEEQYRVICEALDVFSRIGMGQLEIAILETMGKRAPYTLMGSVSGLSVRDYVMERIAEIKVTMYRLNRYAGLGIYNDTVAEDFKIAWDLRMSLEGKDKPKASKHDRK